MRSGAIHTPSPSWATLTQSSLAVKGHCLQTTSSSAPSLHPCSPLVPAVPNCRALLGLHGELAQGVTTSRTVTLLQNRAKSFCLALAGDLLQGRASTERGWAGAMGTSCPSWHFSGFAFTSHSNLLQFLGKETGTNFKKSEC